MTEFKKGDRVAFVKDDSFLGVEMPKGTLATYDDDRPASATARVTLDTGERVIVWSDSIAPAKDHGTGDGSASDICAEPGCNCDLERRFPAPLDPAKVKAGDTVTVSVLDPDVQPEPWTVSGKVYTSPFGSALAVGMTTLRYKGEWDSRVTITDHTPVPEPERWPGTVAVVETEGAYPGGPRRAVRRGGVWHSLDMEGYAIDANVTRVRPLAPLDPAKVKAGDTVTVRVEPNPDTGWGTLDHGPEAIEVTGKVWLDSGDNPHGPVAKVGVHALGLPNVTLTAHTPRPHAERAPEGEVTAAVERGAEDLRSLYLTDQTEPASRYFEEAATVLNAALDVEEMARVISSHRHGSEVPWPEDRRTAEALRAAILGEES